MLQVNRQNGRKCAKLGLGPRAALPPPQPTTAHPSPPSNPRGLLSPTRDDSLKAEPRMCLWKGQGAAPDQEAQGKDTGPGLSRDLHVASKRRGCYSVKSKLGPEGDEGGRKQSGKATGIRKTQGQQ